MKKIISITAALICSFFLQNPVIAQEAPKNPPLKVSKPAFEKPIQKDCKPPMKMPHKVKKAFDFFKFADELQLTDDQIIKLRAFYKKHNSQKPEPPKAPQAVDFYKMTDEELVKYAEEEAMKKKQRLMLKLQKIIDIRKILTKEQLEMIKKEAEKEAENNKKKFEEHRKQKANKSRRPQFPRPGIMPMMPMCPSFSMMPPMGPQPGMMPHMPPMGPQPGMMPHMPPMGPQQGMMPHMPPMGPQQGMMPHMPPMGPQQGMMPHMPPMGPQQGMMPHMPPMGPQCGMMPCMPPMGPQCGMMPHMPPMGPQCGMMPHMPKMSPKSQHKPMIKGDKPGKDKKPSHRFDRNNPFPMMNPMGFYPGFMPQPNMMNCCPCQMRPQMFGRQNGMQERRPPFDFLMKLFSCKKDKESDIINKDKTINIEELFGNKRPQKESLKPNEEKK